MEYTKGEWKVRKAPTNHEIISTLDIMGESDDGVVADVYSCYTGLSESNAHLIAAAPDMYEALKHLVNEISDFHIETARGAWGNTNVSCMEHAREQAKLALAKAGGKGE